MAVFGAAYQNMLAAQGKGGGLTGQAAVAALLEAVPTGNVRSSELLPFVSEEMQRRAAPKLDIARETSQGWQGRLANQRTGWAMVASEAGVEEGQRNFFRFFTQWMNENQDIPERFGKFWKDFSEQFVIAGGFGGLLREALGGEENIILEWLGPEKMAKFIEDFESLANSARAAADFLGLFQKKESDGVSEWKRLAGTAADAVAFGRAIADFNLTHDGGIGVTGMQLIRGITGPINQDAPVPRFRNYLQTQKDILNANTEGFYNPPEFQYGGDSRQQTRDVANMIGELRYERPSAAKLANDAGLSFAQGETIRVGDITIHATSSEPEAIKEAVEEALRQGMPPKSR